MPGNWEQILRQRAITLANSPKGVYLPTVRASVALAFPARPAPTVTRGCVLLLDPQDDLALRVIWPELLSLIARVVYTLPQPLVAVDLGIDNSISPPETLVRLKGAQHGGVYPCLAVATLDDGSSAVELPFVLKGFNA